ncbi:MAG TPA: hypothetical protein VGQ46_22785 [Thermoanaerobaculia bacterium]|jgi:hypothetical protein|nr:hypothetical protein [Thermoanaerobaculia bacterium]
MSKTQRIVSVVIALYLLLVLIDRFVLVELLVNRTGISVLLALFEAFAILGVGFAVRGALARSWRIEDADLPRDFLLGYPIFGTLCFLTGTLNVSSWSMAIILVVCGVGGIYVLVRRFESRPPVMPAITEPLVLIALAIVFLCALIAAQAPPSSLDELAYHLAVPWTWVKEHRAIDLPLISHSYFPLGIESADLPLLTILGQIGGGIASHFLHLGAALAATAVLFRISRGNALALAAIVTTPALALIAGWSLVDWPLIGICAILVLALDDGDAATVSMAIAAGLLTKYTFVPFAVLGCGVWGVGRRRKAKSPDAARTDSHSPLPTPHSLIIGLAIGSIFFIRNLILTANPIAPFFTAAAPHVAGYRAPFLSDYIFDGHFLDESLGASLIAACTLSAGLLPWILIGAAVLLFLLAPSSRILLPFLAIPAARSQRPGGLMRVVLGFAIVVQLFLIGYFVDRGGAFSLLSGAASDAEFMTKQRSSYKTVQSINALLPTDARTLVIGLNETFWFARRVRGGGNFDGPRVSRYLETPTPEALYARLKNDGITHVAVVAPAPASTAVAQKLAERETALSPAAQRMLAQTLDRYAYNVASGAGATVFTLKGKDPGLIR